VSWPILVQDDQMPVMKKPVITKAWRHKGEVGKIHYIAKRADGTTRHLLVNEGTPLYDILEDHLAAIGYTGPASAEEH
jgi:hypothetical protein